MTIIAGIDEAGYGPSIGPFVLSKVVIKIPAKHSEEANLWHVFSDAVSDKIQGRGGRIVVNDSKKVYQQKRGLCLLEEAVLSFLWAAKGQVTKFSDLLGLLSNHDEDVLDKYPWYKGKDINLPVASNVSAILNYADLIKDTISFQDSSILDVKSIFLCVKEINTQIALDGNKSLLLFKNCATHLKEIFEGFGEHGPSALVDKHGGRNYYQELLASSFEGCNVEAVCEGKRISTYKIDNDMKKMNVSFIEKADTKHLPTALASMFSKYIRELFMSLFNAFWQEEVQNIKPTAGYPEDAKRFLSQIYETRTRLGISDDILIRAK